MSYEVAVAGASAAFLLTVGAAAWAILRPGIRARTVAFDPTTDAAIGLGSTASALTADPPTDPPSDPRSDLASDPPSDRPGLDEKSQSALTACVFASAPVDHLAWTAMVIDPALLDTPGHIRLVGWYDTELAATDAAAHLADELNECLVPGEAPLTATALGIEPAMAAEPLNHTGLPIAYSGAPLTGHNALTDRDGAPLGRR